MAYMQFNWRSDSEESFVQWFNGEYGMYSCRSEWFFGDCEVGDENTRKELLYKWVHAAYVSGYQDGFANRMITT